MRIVSQNRDLSIDFNRCEIWTQDNFIYRRIGTDNQVIGRYSSPERVAEVFEDIHKAYAPVYSISDNLTEEQIQGMFIQSKNIAVRNILNTGCDMSVTTYDNYVYYMPKE